jgi:DNA-binding response OmpR family regulator
LGEGAASTPKVVDLARDLQFRSGSADPKHRLEGHSKQRCSVLVLDFELIPVDDVTPPEMDGTQVLAEVQMNYPELSSTPFIFLTALTDKGTMLEALRSGADDYMVKPVDFDVLLAKVEGCAKKVENARKTGRAF